jgi:hypothetical protein
MNGIIDKVYAIEANDENARGHVWNLPQHRVYHRKKLKVFDSYGAPTPT